MNVDKKDIENLLTAGNHLASFLISKLGGSLKGFPSHTASLETGLEIIKDIDLWDAWVCWRGIMIFRDLYPLEDER